MGYPKRTAFCEKCGSVGFKIRQGDGAIDYVCSECYSNFANVSCDDYETLETICKKCNSDVFKIKIQENNGEENWSIACANCQEAPGIKYIDDEGIEVDRILRELLVVKRSITKLEDDIGCISEEMKKINLSINEINNRNIVEVEELDDIHSSINRINSVVEKQKIKTINLDDDISKIRNRLNSMCNY